MKNNDGPEKFTIVHFSRVSKDPFLKTENRIMHDFTQCLLRGCDPTTMTIVFPDVINGFVGSSDEKVELVNSFNLPKVRLTIKANRMMGPAVVQ